MIEMTLSEAQLYRLLVDFFGKDSVIPRMRVIAVCGGEISSALREQDQAFPEWAEHNHCLFTVVDREDNPRMVVEFFSGLGRVLDAEQVEHQRYLKPALRSLGIHYVTISDAEFSEMLDPGSNKSFSDFLIGKFERSGITL